MNKSTIIVTGATGLIGANLVAGLASQADLHCVARRSDPGVPATWHAMDLASNCDFSGLPKSADALVYLAQSEHFRNFPEHSLDVYQVNTVNLLRALDYARRAGVRNFVYASSGGVYGTGENRMSEEIPIPARGNLGFYLSTKLCSEIVAQNYAQYFNVVILRYFFVYGPGQRQSMLIPRLIQRVRDGQPLVLQGEDGIRTNPVHVSDAVAATRRALELDRSHTVNVGGPEVLSLREIGRLIGEAVGREPIFKTDNSSPPGHLAGDITRMRDLLVAPKVRFADGIRTLL